MPLAHYTELAPHRWAFVLALAFASTPALVSAAPCGRPDLESVLPLDGATDVPLNIAPTAQYPATAEYDGEEVLFGTDRSALEPVPVIYNEAEGLLSLSSGDRLEPDTHYYIEWPELRGFGSASRGLGGSAEFVTGDRDDVENPTFDGVRSVEYDLERERDECTDRVEDRFVFTLDLAPADDDGGRESLSIVILQTSGPRIDGPVPVRVAPAPENDRLEVRLPIDDSVGQVCFAAVARDLRPGSAPAGGNARACVHAVEPPFFYGCHTTRRGHSGHLPIAWALGFVAACGMRRRRRVT